MKSADEHDKTIVRTLQNETRQTEQMKTFL
jgi:hypothetical protein